VPTDVNAPNLGTPRAESPIQKAGSMVKPEVHWHEGMFLRQHHFLLTRRHFLHVVDRGDKWGLHYNWGLRSIRLNADALANFRLVVSSLAARLRDGTMIEVPEGGNLPEIDLKPAFERERSVTVFLALPSLKSGRANVSEAGAVDDARYSVVTQQWEDENSGINPQPVSVRVPNLKLLLSTEELTGFEVLPIARVAKSERPEATPELDTTYFPPVLACDAWYDLQVGILQAVYDRIGRKMERLANQIVSRNLTPDNHSHGDSLIFSQLRELNEAYAALANLAFVEGMHPLGAYQELCRLVGQLAIFSPARRPPAIPRYNHDDLGGCFFRIRRHLDELLSIVPEPEYHEGPFIGAGLRMQVTLERDWLGPTAQMFIGVQTTLKPEETIRLMRPGSLDMKVGSSDRVESIFRMGNPGLQFTHALNPPQALPRAPGLIYFSIHREAQDLEWQYVERSLSLAIRLNEELVAGTIDRERVLSLKSANMETTIKFTLYVLTSRNSGTATVGLET